jgi:single-stranded-DNA-specific exonuclease
MDEVEAQWITVEVDEKQAQELATALSVPLPVAKVLVARGVVTPEAAARFLNPRLSDLTDPFELSGMRPAVDRLWRAIDGQERITVYGDYDADGVTSTALLMLVLRHFGAVADFFIPRRLEDGYGFTLGALEKVIDATHPSLIVTADCGTRSSPVVAEATKRGIDVIITDHHEGIDSVLPDAVSVINPKISGPPCTEMLAGVGVVFKLCHAMVKQALSDGRPAAGTLDLRDFLDLVAIGTVADVVPLTGENRTLVRYGLNRLNGAVQRCGIQALMRVAGVRTKIDCYHLGFLIGPRLNAAGRLGSAELGLELLMTLDAGRARRLAGQLDASNRERKRIEESIIEEAAAEVEASFNPAHSFGLVASHRGWHIGTIGIVAARIAGRFRRPSVVIAINDEGIGRASCRSVESVNLVSILDQCADLLVSYGGHSLAAGFTIAEANIEAFRSRFNACCRGCIQDSDMVETHVVDAWISLGEADQALVESVEALRPLGLGNQTPIWGARGVRILGQPKPVGGSHMKMTLVSGATQVDAIGFGMAGRKFGKEDLDILFQIQLNNYMGKESIQLSLKDFRFRESV